MFLYFDLYNYPNELFLDYSEAGVETFSNTNQLTKTTNKYVACNEKILDYVEDSDDSLEDPNYVETPNHTSDEGTYTKSSQKLLIII